MAGTDSTDSTVETGVDTTGGANGAGVPSARPSGPAPAPSPAAQYRLSPGTGEEALSLSETPPQPHRARRPIMAAGVLLLLLGAAALWWFNPAGWVWPWEQPPGPLTGSGTLEADEVLAAFEVAGRIVEIVQEGQAVQADEIVARLDDSLIQVQIVQATLAARQQLEIQAARYQLHSPIAGVVTRVPMHVGEVASPGQTAVTVADLTSLKLTAYVLESDLGGEGVQVGQEVVVTADPFPDRAFRAVVTSINPRAEFTPRNVQTKADRLNLVFGVNLRVDNPDMALKPGMPADVNFSPAN